MAVYELLRSAPNILASRLLYHRIPVQHVGPRLDLPLDIAGRRLFLFERAEGKKCMVRSQPGGEGACQCQSSALPNSTDNLLSRPIFLLTQPVFVHHSSTSIPPSTSPQSGSANTSLNRSLNHFPFPLLPPASSALLFSLPGSKRQSGT